MHELRRMNFLKDPHSSQSDSDAGLRFKLGISTNFNKLCGCVPYDESDPVKYLDRFPKRWPRYAPRFNIPEVQRLYEEVDFIGVTTYSSAAPNFHTREIAKAMEEFEKEASIMGLKLKDLLRNRCTPIHFTEFGVGGG